MTGILSGTYFNAQRLRNVGRKKSLVLSALQALNSAFSPIILLLVDVVLRVIVMGMSDCKT